MLLPSVSRLGYGNCSRIKIKLLEAKHASSAWIGCTILRTLFIIVVTNNSNNISGMRLQSLDKGNMETVDLFISSSDSP